MQLQISVDHGAFPAGRGRGDTAVALLVRPPAEPGPGSGDDGSTGVLVPTVWSLPEPLPGEVAAFLGDIGHRGEAGALHRLARPTRTPSQLLLVGMGDGRPRAWRDIGAALVRATSERMPSVVLALPADSTDVFAGELALGAWLASYRFASDGSAARSAPRSARRRITLIAAAGDVAVAREAVASARALAQAVTLARDLTNTPSAQKSPQWFADRVARAASRRTGVALTVLDEIALADAGFGGVLAVGGGSTRPPRFVELSWRPRGARTHVVLVGKGICFDSGGISIKPLDAMKLMRKDMGAAATVCATVLAAADLRLPVRVTALAPLAENLVSGSSMRPGDVIRHYGGQTTEVLDTDAEGRLVLADALAYAARRLRPDYLIDLATLTGASHVALGKQTAALFSDDPALADALRVAGDEAGEPVWRLPLTDDYLGLLRSDVADLANIGQPSQAGAIVAALFLRELTGECRDRWAHIDMSAPAWSDRETGPLAKGATGWGVRLLVRFLSTLTARGALIER
ncbi:MAG TPA: leucyl aminopeptidase [Micromonosporaceae bacterium]|jgi:leucyl aminopeptidase